MRSSTTTSSWDNCLVITAGESRRATRLALVDWEFADLGNACWDTGSVFGNYLNFWLVSIPVTGEEPPDRYLELAKYPLTRMQPAMRAFWAAYVDARGWDCAAAQSALVRCTKYAGVRLLQSVYERSQNASRLDGNSICQLQLALNVITRPLEAINHLLGIDLAASGVMKTRELVAEAVGAPHTFDLQLSFRGSVPCRHRCRQGRSQFSQRRQHTTTGTYARRAALRGLLPTWSGGTVTVDGSCLNDGPPLIRVRPLRGKRRTRLRRPRRVIQSISDRHAVVRKNGLDS